MFKQKYLWILCVGLTLGIGLFGFISYSIKNDSAVITTLDIVESPAEESVVNEIDQVLSINEAGNSQRPVIIISTEKNEIEGKSDNQVLEDFVSSHSDKYLPLFKKLVDPREMYSKRTPNGYARNYLSFLRKNKETIWSKEAEYALTTYFSQRDDKRYNIARINCKENTCELVGVMNYLDYDEFDPYVLDNHFQNNWRQLYMTEFKEDSILFNLITSPYKLMKMNYVSADGFGYATFSCFIGKSRNYRE